MTQNQIITLVVSLVFGVFAGYYVAQKAAAREKIYGGTPAAFLNYLACVFMVSVVPGVLVSVILRDGFLFSISLAIGFVLLAIVSCMLFSLFENAPRKAALSQKVDRGWTEQDARTSGL